MEQKRQETMSESQRKIKVLQTNCAKVAGEEEALTLATGVSVHRAPVAEGASHTLETDCDGEGAAGSRREHLHTRESATATEGGRTGAGVERQQ